MSMSPRLLRPRSTLHPEAAAWAARVVANGGTVSGTTLSAVSKFCAAIDAAGIRDRFLRLNLFCGGGLNACLVPLYRNTSPSGSPLGNATDINTGGLFLSGDYVETGSASGGLQGGGTKYLETGIADNLMPSGDTHLSTYEITGPTGTFALSLGVRETGVVNYTILGTWASTSLIAFLGFTNTALLNQSTGARTGHFIGNTSATISSAIYRNGTVNVSSGANTARTPSSTQHTVFALNTGGSVGSHSNGRLGGYSLGLKFTDAQALAYYNAIQAFQTSLSRSV